MNKKQIIRDKKAIANKKICFEVRATAIRPRLHHREGFPQSTIGSSTKGPYTKELQPLEVHNFLRHFSNPETA